VQKDAATSVPLALHTLVSVIIGLYLVSLDEMSLGGLVIVIRFSSSFMYEMRTIVNTFTKLQEHLASADRVMDIFELPEENYNPALTTQVETTAKSGVPAAECQHVTFGYTEETPVFKGLCLSINQNKTTALVGKSGSGKSTILKLYMGFYPFEGDMSLMGQTCRSYGLQTLRRLTAYVPQTASLFAGTIYENIAYGRENATYDEVIQAAKQAHAHRFITEMPLGYDTLITERGIQLSGGQRQRICIARAILKDAPIILLDEATSSLDSQSEEMIQQAIDDIGTRKTIVVVAHRLSTIVHADKIIVFDRGEIVEQGTHEELMHAAGAYRKLYESQ
jgi:ATP-binding cassette subfamily B protein